MTDHFSTKDCFWAFFFNPFTTTVRDQINLKNKLTLRVMAHYFNVNTQEADAGGSRVSSQPKQNSRSTMTTL